MPETTEQHQSFAEFVAARFGGILSPGAHEPNGVACVLEARSQYLGIQWTDDPEAVGRPDYRGLNDARWPDDASRTGAMLDLDTALDDWEEWPGERKQRWSAAVALRTGREVLPVALEAVGLPEHAEACRKTESLPGLLKAAGAAWAAARAAWAAGAGAAEAAARAAEAAAEAAEAAAEAGAARAAARAAWAAGAARAAAEAARAAGAGAAEAAARAAEAAAEAGAEEVLQLACRIWIEEAEQSNA